MKSVSIFAVPANLPESERLKRRHMLARLGLAWLIMMQAMMFAFPGYMRNEYLHSESLATLDTAIIVMNWINFALAIPVMLYCAAPVWKGLFRQQGNAAIVNMDWPVALGILVAFIPSAMNTITQTGEVYFESISMFVAFLLTARYLEFAAQQSAKFNVGAVDPELESVVGRISLRADRVAFIFVLLQIALAIVTALVWYLYIDAAHAVPVLVSLFVMSCPCAMAMAVPTASSAARAALLNLPHVSQHTRQRILQQTITTANQNLYGSLIWHLLMTPLAMAGIVAPWLAAITMLLSSLAVAWNSYRFYKKYLKEAQLVGSGVSSPSAV